MDDAKRARFDLAQEVLPAPLLEALCFVFSQQVTGMALVGGTALSGFYAGHRRSDDLDLFVDSDDSCVAATHAVKALSSIQVKLGKEFQSRQYYKAVCELSGHSFTVDVVLDRNLFSVGNVETVNENIVVASLKTLLMMKSATLVSRASEKDLYDLLWLFKQFPKLELHEFIELGKQIDGGVTGEAILISLGSTAISKQACDFAIQPRLSPEQVFKEISQLKRRMISEISSLLHKQPSSHPLKALVSTAKKAK